MSRFETALNMVVKKPGPGVTQAWIPVWLLQVMAASSWANYLFNLLKMVSSSVKCGW